MLFTQAEFFLFLLATLVGVQLLARPRRQKVLLLVASYYFYAYWDWRFLGLILFSTGVDFVIGRQMSRTDDSRVRKRLLIVSLVSNLGLLATFKYFDFFVESMQAVLAPLGIHVGSLGLILPIGISFYTFQTLSYTIDLYRRKIPPCRDPLDFALFVAFFPQLVAGPIVRAAHFLPQLDGPVTRSRYDVFHGVRQFILGLFKKVFIADNLARFVDEVFAQPGGFDAATTWLAVAAYAIQIYCDFAGYSDMAIGTARIVGFRFETNFNFPYLARSFSDFWRRWHISLSSWLRDYLYIPLGGNRHGRVRTIVSLMLTMLLGGLWHGAAWTFVVWGAIHGLALVAQRVVTARLPADLTERSFVARFSAHGITLFVVLLAWVFFRAPSFDAAGRTLGAMFGGSTVGVAWYFPFALIAVAGTLVVHLLHASGRGTFLTLPLERRSTPVVLLAMVWLVILNHPRSFNPFIYFQF